VVVAVVVSVPPAVSVRGSTDSLSIRISIFSMPSDSSSISSIEPVNS
jgi:hypothetical protein